MRNFFLAMIVVVASITGCGKQQVHDLVIQTDFGLKDGAVSEMKGVAQAVDDRLQIFDLTHEIPAYNIWEASYRLNQTVPFWPEGTVFVSVVDPGVGTPRKSVVVKTGQGHYIVTPDNGTLTLIAGTEGIEAVREIDENVNRRKGSEKSYTFHGRDVYVYTAARLASGKISFNEVGPVLNQPLVTIDYKKAALDTGVLSGNIPILDIQYGNVWTNISDSLTRLANIKTGDSLRVKISWKDSVVYNGNIVFVNTFGQVPEGKPLAYINSLMNLSFALNMGSFSSAYGVKSGPEWNVIVTRE